MRKSLKMLLSPSFALAYSYDRPMNWDEVLRQGIGLYSESQLTFLPQFWMPSSFMDQRWRRGHKVKRQLILQMSARMASLRHGDVLISLFLPSPRGQISEQRHCSLTVEGKILWEYGHIMYIYNNKNNGKQPYKQFQHGIRTDFPCNNNSKIFLIASI